MSKLSLKRFVSTTRIYGICLLTYFCFVPTNPSYDEDMS